MAFKQIHDLSKLDDAALKQYLRDVSTFIKLDPDANLLDTIWMQNENGVGSSLVVYAKRGTAEILRDLHQVSVDSLTSAEINGSIVFTAKGHNVDGRTEVAVGSKYIATLMGKQHDNSVMTASTRALRRLTLQFTGLGILDESEVAAVEPSTHNPAATVQLAPAAPAPAVQPNPAPARIVELPPAFVAPAVPAGTFATNQAEHIAAAQAQASAKLAQNANPDTNPDTVSGFTPSESTPASNPDISADKTSAPKSARKPRKAKNAVSLGDVEPETVSAEATASSQTATSASVDNYLMAKATAPEPVAAAVPTPAAPPASVAALAPPPQAPPTPTAPPPAAVPAGDFPGKPSEEQMKAYRSKVSTFTAQIPASEGQGSVQKMRSFITQMTGKPPAALTVEEWEDQLSWFDTYVAQHSVKELVEYINAFVGAK